MKHITLALLLSCAPVIIKADDKCGSCDRTEQLENNNESATLENRTENTQELTNFNVEEVQTATSAFLTLSKQTMSDAGWDYLAPQIIHVYEHEGKTPTVHTNDTLTFVFERGELSLEEWTTVLWNIERKFQIIEKRVNYHPDCIGGLLTLGLNQ